MLSILRIVPKEKDTQKSRHNMITKIYKMPVKTEGFGRNKMEMLDLEIISYVKEKLQSNLVHRTGI